MVTSMKGLGIIKDIVIHPVGNTDVPNFMAIQITSYKKCWPYYSDRFVFLKNISDTISEANVGLSNFFKVNEVLVHILA